MRVKVQKGFTLLEAVIAIAIFSMGATALYGWVNSNLITLERIDHINTRSSAIESALAFMNTIDPLAMPQGSVQLGDLKVDWITAPTAYKNDVLDEQNSKTINQASLINADVSVYRQDTLIGEFKLSLLGVKKIRELNDVFFN